MFITVMKMESMPIWYIASHGKATDFAYSYKSYDVDINPSNISTITNSEINTCKEVEYKITEEKRFFLFLRWTKKIEKQTPVYRNIPALEVTMNNGDEITVCGDDIEKVRRACPVTD